MLQRKNMHTADLAAIEKLHKADVDATLTQDPSYLTKALVREQWHKPRVPRPTCGGNQSHEETPMRNSVPSYPDFKVLKYAPEIKDVQIADDSAMWGAIFCRPRT